jgi:hypothetical protein
MSLSADAQTSVGAMAFGAILAPIEKLGMNCDEIRQA